MILRIDDILNSLTGAQVVHMGYDKQQNVCGFAWDSRLVEPEWIFFAIAGERSDGHDFVEQAVQSGARVVVGSDVDKLRGAAVHAPEAIYLAVPAIDEAVQSVAHVWYKTLDAVVVGITGSVGKTTTRSLVAAVLAQKYRVHATSGNFNNELGLPATVMQAPADTEILVLEMGMDGAGQIRQLCSVAPPTCGVITTIGTSHMMQLGSQENIARAKAEIFEGMGVGSCAILPGNSEFTSFIQGISDFSNRGISTYYFPELGASAQNDIDQEYRVWPDKIGVNEAGFPTCVMHARVADNQVEQRPVTLSLRGVHNISNACAAIEVGLHFGIHFDACIEAVSLVGAEEGRQKMHMSSSGVVVIDDAYNASPESMVASLDMFASLSCNGARIAVLGDMGELGDFEAQGHLLVARHVGGLYKQGLVERVIFVGAHCEYMKEISDIPSNDCYTADDAHMAADIVMDVAQREDMVLVKASHFMNMGVVVERILQA